MLTPMGRLSKKGTSGMRLIFNVRCSKRRKVRSAVQHLRLGRIKMFGGRYVRLGPIMVQSRPGTTRRMQQAYATSPLFFSNLHFDDFVKVSTWFEIDTFDEIVEMEIREKRGTSGIRLD